MLFTDRLLVNSDDLRTSYESVRAGFVSLALEKNRRATPFVAQARALKSAASKATTATDLLKFKEIYPALITAAGVSDKATKHLDDKNKIEAIAELIRNFLEPAGGSFVEELVFRFLLTRGDTLGGSMRNVGGFIAQCKLTRCIISILKIAGRTPHWYSSETKTWADLPEDDTGIETRLRGLHWKTEVKHRTRHRTLMYNLVVPLVKNNVDLCLFHGDPTDITRVTYNDAKAYIALGELKGGIDPAGADEHWKTASTALARIRNAFEARDCRPCTFFIGAAIEAKMSREIWMMLEAGILDNAANLTEDSQMDSISSWLCGL